MLHERILLSISFILALGLSIAPLPQGLAVLRPDYFVLLIVLWFIYKKTSPGLAGLWFICLCHDLLTNSLLGQHATALFVVIFFCHKLARHWRCFSPWQQVFLVFSLVLVNQLLLGLLEGFRGNFVLLSAYLMPAVVSGLLWFFACLAIHFWAYRERLA